LGTPEKSLSMADSPESILSECMRWIESEWKNKWEGKKYKIFLIFISIEILILVILEIMITSEVWASLESLIDESGILHDSGDHKNKV